MAVVGAVIEAALLSAGFLTLALLGDGLTLQDQVLTVACLFGMELFFGMVRKYFWTIRYGRTRLEITEFGVEVHSRQGAPIFFAEWENIREIDVVGYLGWRALFIVNLLTEWPEITVVSKDGRRVDVKLLLWRNDVRIARAAVQQACNKYMSD